MLHTRQRGPRRREFLRAEQRRGFELDEGDGAGVCERRHPRQCHPAGVYGYTSSGEHVFEVRTGRDGAVYGQCASLGEDGEGRGRGEGGGVLGWGGVELGYGAWVGCGWRLSCTVMRVGRGGREGREECQGLKGLGVILCAMQELRLLRLILLYTLPGKGRQGPSKLRDIDTYYGQRQVIARRSRRTVRTLWVRLGI